ncbi:GPW/gp25 family protein [Hymenobacter volaticus]|uniref:GPW/gp25 family protein n=1 Tax=Hymenobacter volaticus TaxID=2932254 RepID=A0ABY4G2L2_9BACT|nr:GPW/gp25 family protein [Hymenobacter volaticus]UOQ64809.1 GPW/gp25 family protein [Hymenobacter volaticus]
MNQPINSIKYPFAINQQLGMLMEEKDFSRHVRQMMLQVLFTNPGERINRPDFGCGIRRMVFAPNSDATASLSEVLITQALDRWLGELITTENIEVTAMNERLEINIVYLLKVKQERQFLNVQI